VVDNARKGVVVAVDAEGGKVAGMALLVWTVAKVAVVGGVGEGAVAAGGAAHSQTKLPANVGMESQTKGTMVAWKHLVCGDGINIRGVHEMSG
jgi:hypothetical protein